MFPELDLNTVIAIVIILGIERLITYKLKHKNKAKYLQDNTEDGIVIYPILWAFLIDTSAVRVFITQFHNGEKYYSGKHIQRMSISHEVTASGVIKIKALYTDILLDEITHNILTELKRKELYKINIEKNESIEYDLKNSLEVLDIKSIYTFPLRNKQGLIVAVLNFNFKEARVLDEKEIVKINIAKSQIENVLNN